jgi:hypothetical protein
MVKGESKWTEEKTLEELKKIKEKVGHFPTFKELNAMSQSSLGAAILKHGGSNKFRELLGEELLQTPAGFWTEEKTLEELKKVKDEIGHFPTRPEFRTLGRGDLEHAIPRHGGSNRFRELLGAEIIQAPAGFWTDEKILEKLKKIKDEIGHFPSQKELAAMDRADLQNAIQRHGGSNYFRNLLGVELIRVSAGHWTIEKILEDLKKIMDDIGHFPL